MPSWNQLLAEFTAVPDQDKPAWFSAKLPSLLADISALRHDRNVIFYSSAFLEKPTVPGYATQITHEDLNAFMAVIHGMDWAKGLTLLLHTPGGVTNAAETLVAYLRSKFDSIEVIVPALAMSAGTMISLSAERIIMGRQSQLGPIDPQMPVGGRFISARAAVEQFDRAKTEILADQLTAHAWAPILSSLGPAMLQEAQNALDYGEQMVATWNAKYMFDGDPQAVQKGAAVAAHFNDATKHKSHGRRIDRDEARGVGVVVDDLENDQPLQEAVLSAYHVLTILFSSSPAAKVLWSTTGASFIKNLANP